MNKLIDEITIVGGGTAGWLMALFITTLMNSKQKPSNVKVTLIESPNLPTVGVGEGTTPGFAQLLQTLGIDEVDFMRNADATFKCAGKFVGWDLDKKGKPISFYHPFTPGGVLDGEENICHYQKFGPQAGALSYVDNVLPTQMVVEEGLAPKFANHGAFESVIPYTYHLHAHGFARQLSSIARERGVRHIQDEMLEVNLQEDGAIRSLTLKENGELPVQFVIDCTGFSGRILQGALKEPFISYANHLLCDRAIPLPVPHKNPQRVEACTAATALSAGWVFSVPLISRVGKGYIYSSQFLSDDEALAELKQHLGDQVPDDATPRVIRMKIGRVRNTWVKNCIATGLSAGFVEPLEATAIYTIEMTARLLVTYFPSFGVEPVVVKQFNSVMNGIYEDILAFITMTYYTANRPEPFWQAARNDIDVPDKLRERLDLWKHTLPSIHDVDSRYLFGPWSYMYLLQQKGFFEGVKFPRDSLLSRESWVEYSRKVTHAKSALRKQLPTHHEWLMRIRDQASPARAVRA